jgi:hypothetical protein
MVSADYRLFGATEIQEFLNTPTLTKSSKQLGYASNEERYLVLKPSGRAICTNVLTIVIVFK